MTRMQPPVEPMKRKRVILTTVQLVAVAAVVLRPGGGYGALWRMSDAPTTPDYASSAFHWKRNKGQISISMERRTIDRWSDGAIHSVIRA